MNIEITPRPDLQLYQDIQQLQKEGFISGSEAKIAKRSYDQLADSMNPVAVSERLLSIPQPKVNLKDLPRDRNEEFMSLKIKMDEAYNLFDWLSSPSYEQDSRIQIDLDRIDKLALIFYRQKPEKESTTPTVNISPEEAVRKIFLAQRELGNFVEYWKPLAGKIFERYKTFGIEHNDAINIILMGFMKGVIRFDPAKEINLTTYLMYIGKYELMDEMRRRSTSSRTTVKNKKTIEEFEDEFVQRNERFPTREEIYQQVGLSRDVITSTFDAQKSTVSLDQARTRINSKGGRDLTIEDTIADDSNQIEEFPDNEERQFQYDQLATYVDALPHREKAVLSYYYKDGLTMKQISEKMGVSESRISQLHYQGIERLRIRFNADSPLEI